MVQNYHRTERFSIMILILPGVLPSIGVVTLLNAELVIVPRLDSSVFAEYVVCNTSNVDDAFGVV